MSFGKFSWPGGYGSLPTNGLCSSRRSKRLPLIRRNRRRFLSAVDVHPARPLYRSRLCLSFWRQKIISRYLLASTSFWTRRFSFADKPAVAAGISTLLNFASWVETVSYTHLRAHETPEHLVC